MLKLFVLSAFISGNLILITEQSVLSELTTKNKLSPNISSSDIILPICYIQKADGTYLNLSHICGKVSKEPIVNSEILQENEQTNIVCLQALKLDNVSDEYLNHVCQ